MIKIDITKAIKISKASLVGVCVVVAILGFAAGLMLDNTTLGNTLNARLAKVFSRDDKGTSNAPEDLTYLEVEEVYDRLRKSYDGEIDTDLLIAGMKKGLAAATGDPYTIFLTAEEAKEFSKTLNNEFSGIGAEIAIKNHQLQVVSPIKGLPAEKAGIRSGDLIFAINDEDTADMFIDEAVSKIRGPEGSEVKLTIGRNGSIEELKITREKIDIPNTTLDMLDGGICHIEISTFGENSASETSSAARKCKQQGGNSIILDLRGNGGGLLEAAVDIAGLWLDNNVVVEQKGKEQHSYRSSGRGTLYGIETIVLINKGSASASEIVAGSLRDHGVAKLLGETTFGKGSVQNLEKFSDGSELKVTIARWFTPNGKNIDNEGVKPDIEVKLTNEDFDNNRDPQLDRALEILRAN